MIDESSNIVNDESNIMDTESTILPDALTEIDDHVAYITPTTTSASHESNMRTRNPNRLLHDYYVHATKVHTEEFPTFSQALKSSQRDL